MSNIIAQFFSLEAEAEAHLPADRDARNRCSIIRGRLELARDHGEPFNLEDMERDFARLVELLTGTEDWRTAFLGHLRWCAESMRREANL